MTDSKSLAEIEAETAAMEAKLAKLQAKKRERVKAKAASKPIVRDGDRLRAIQSDQRVKGATAALANSHGGYGGKTLINKIESDMDRCRKRMESMIVEHGVDACTKNPSYWLAKGRYQGFAGSLARLRNTDVNIETARSNQRLGIGGGEDDSDS